MWSIWWLESKRSSPSTRSWRVRPSRRTTSLEFVKWSAKCSTSSTSGINSSRRKRKWELLIRMGQFIEKFQLVISKLLNSVNFSCFLGLDYYFHKVFDKNCIRRELNCFCVIYELHVEFLSVSMPPSSPSSIVFLDDYWWKWQKVLFRNTRLNRQCCSLFFVTILDV